MNLLVNILCALAVDSARDDSNKVAAVASIGLTVADLDRQLAFYTEVLDFELRGIEEHAGDAHERLEGVFGLRKRVARLTLGTEAIELTEFLAPEGRPIPTDSRSNDRWFQHIAIVVSDMDRAYLRLRAADVRHASSGPQRLPDWNPNAAGIEAFYFKDPEGHVLELIEFPLGKGDPRWHRAQPEPAPLFLGIDHTAVVVANTERSIALYRDVLGLEVVGRSENHGIEQERLNNVFGARLAITTLRAPEGPGVELLEYLAPANGRPYPADVESNDLVHWETRFVVRDLVQVTARLRQARVTFESPAPVELGDGRAALLVRDHDGHALEFHRRTASTETR
jgi:catechol 2,3-dioxygenase-like lactoylglutathione lyase family enzyme